VWPALGSRESEIPVHRSTDLPAAPQEQLPRLVRESEQDRAAASPDLRDRGLIERKALLQQIVKKKRARTRTYASIGLSSGATRRFLRSNSSTRSRSFYSTYAASCNADRVKVGRAFGESGLKSPQQSR
jgi:hypothetical protein